MLILLFFILIIQNFSFLIFEPLTALLTNFLEIKIFPLYLLLIFVWLFSNENEKHIS